MLLEDLGIVRLLLEAHELGVDAIQTLAGFGQEIPQQLVHTTRLVGPGANPRRRSHNVFSLEPRAPARAVVARRDSLIGRPVVCCQRV